MTEQAKQELEAHQSDIDRWFMVEDVLNSNDVRREIFEVLGI
jgi:hypothetical protein